MPIVVLRRIRAQTYRIPWPQPILRFSVFQWYARKIGRQPEKETNEDQYIMSGVANVVDSDGRRLKCDSGLYLPIKPVLLYRSFA
uniref:DUF5641 domain-containing protein n=1 Tax=Mesocestoides corti TaxID=53468 RepID=A0A5K3F588_MESCO